MDTRFQRLEILIGKEAMDRLAAAHVAVFGLGGVGGYVCEALARAGIGSFDLIDSDKAALTNMNRQIIALDSTIGRLKTDLFKERILQINPEASVRTFPVFYLPETKELFDFTQYDYVIDAIDTVTAKLDIIEECQKHNVPVISSMGTGNRLDPSGIVCGDIYETSGDPLARVMRRELRKRGVEHLKVVYSSLPPLKPLTDAALLEETERRSIPGSSPFVPPTAGLKIAYEVVKDLIL
ncbi:MAG: tRNA threonylcarbamoyladenosine dehydratase [Solobacterium sp.]|nr:tRNA threonylcarbamoyladenosine dehydratase [Solobacterium sp.]